MTLAWPEMILDHGDSRVLIALSIDLRTHSCILNLGKNRLDRGLRVLKHSVNGYMVTKVTFTIVMLVFFPSRFKTCIVC